MSSPAALKPVPLSSNLLEQPHFPSCHFKPLHCTSYRSAFIATLNQRTNKPIGLCGEQGLNLVLTC